MVAIENYAKYITQNWWKSVPHGSPDASVGSSISQKGIILTK